MLIVQKYGGATLANPEKIKQVAQRIADLKKSGTQVVAVVSAMGQTTNELIKLAHQVSNNPSLRELDMLLSVGERTSMALVTMALNDLNCPAISFTGSQAGILTDDSHINANIIDVKGFRVTEAVQDNKVVILAGFQGVSPNTKEITTLGRGGSDTTAVAMAAFLKAERCEILKDVEGVMTADPKVIPSAKLIKNMNYDHLLEMTLWGAKVLHYKSVEMAKNKKVQLYVGPARNHTSDGTLISDQNICQKPQALSVNSYSQVFKFKTNISEFNQAQKKFLTHLKSLQIGEPYFLSQSFENSMNEFYISGPDEILSAILNISDWGQNFQIVRSDLCSVSLTWTQSPELSQQSAAQNILTENHITSECFKKTNLNLNWILEKNHRTQAMVLMHQFIQI